jgi:multidrug efflux pump subunit AcrB
MGVSITSGAVTTFGSGAFLFGGFLILFQKFALLITSTIAISYFIAMVFFGAMSHCFGPESFEKDEKNQPKNKYGDDMIIEKELEESGVESMSERPEKQND